MSSGEPGSDDVPAHRGSQSTRRLIWGGAFMAGTLTVVLIIALQFATPSLELGKVLLALLVALAPSFVWFWISGLRLARVAGPPASIGAATGATALGTLGSMVLPGRLFELIRPIVLNLANGLPVARGLGAVAVERVLDVAFLAALMLIALGGAAAQYGDVLRWNALIFGALAVGGALVVLAAVSMPRITHALVERLPSAWLKRAALDIVVALGRSGDKATLAWATSQSAILWIVAYLTAFAIIEIAGGIALSPVEVLFVFVAGTLGAAIAIAPGGLGTFEGAVVLTLGTFGYSVADGLTLAILLRAGNTLPAVPLSIWFLVQSRTSLRDILVRMRTGRGQP